ncbi:hypothetical protein Goklo_026346 [Gossypium klotzschianum]|uniref:BED-type domain-containing protein n=1 Tax=Gossypium klotzschianum TaxID=34286 RepID=A0A7J8TUM6_9ROSI|nr:hypothetical protein [Gossypium klotzschianum]
MTKLECKNKNELKVQCNHCKSIFSTKSSSRTSHLRRHLNNCLKKLITTSLNTPWPLNHHKEMVHL